MQDHDQWVAERTDEANEVSARLLSLMQATEDSWGFYAWGDAPGGIGGGVGVFYWLLDLPSLREFLAAHGAFLFPLSGRKDMRTVDAEVKVIASDLLDGGSAEAVRGRLNGLLKGEAQFDWIGCYADLLADDGEFPRRLRSQFRGGELDHQPIASDERTEFDDHLTTYGV